MRILTAFFLFFIGLQLAWGADNIEALVEQEVNQYIDNLSSKRLVDVEKTANEITASGLANEKLFEQVSKTLDKYFTLQQENPKDNLLTDVVNSLIRALGSSGIHQYASKLQSIIETGKNRGTRNRANHVLKKISWYSERNLTMQNYDNHQPGQSLYATRYLNLLQDSRLVMSRFAAEELYRSGKPEQPILDWLSNSVQKGTVNQLKRGEKLYVDTIAWHCRVLVKLGREKYTGMIREVIAHEEAQPKIAKHCKKEMKRQGV